MLQLLVVYFVYFSRGTKVRLEMSFNEFLKVCYDVIWRESNVKHFRDVFFHQNMVVVFDFGMALYLPTKNAFASPFILAASCRHLRPLFTGIVRPHKKSSVATDVDFPFVNGPKLCFHPKTHKGKLQPQADHPLLVVLLSMCRYGGFDLLGNKV